jgi:pyruvate/2-oxoglutarate dehydrogenase complex dihydrolipoamide acyltransferase (E2) component
MRGQSQRSSNRVWLGLAILGAAGIGGLVAGLNARSAFGTASSTTVVADMPASDVVSLRFPADFEVADSEPVPRTLAFASADSSMLFSPKPTYALADARSVPANLSPASTSLAAAPVAEPLPKPKPAAQAAPAPAAAAAAPAQPKMVLASASTKPVVAAAPKPARKSNTVLNDSQLASIKKRLNLTPDQERYWPAVEAELRKMEYTKTADNKSTQGTRMASIDTSKMDIQGLKSAGFPLVMSFSDDQRRELKSLTHLLGLESVMSGL